jgi:hypothetical protein
MRTKRTVISMPGDHGDHGDHGDRVADRVADRVSGGTPPFPNAAAAFLNAAAAFLNAAAAFLGPVFMRQPRSCECGSRVCIKYF